MATREADKRAVLLRKSLEGRKHNVHYKLNKEYVENFTDTIVVNHVTYDENT